VLAVACAKLYRSRLAYFLQNPARPEHGHRAGRPCACPSFGSGETSGCDAHDFCDILSYARTEASRIPERRKSCRVNLVSGRPYSLGHAQSAARATQGFAKRMYNDWVALNPAPILARRPGPNSIRTATISGGCQNAQPRQYARRQNAPHSIARLVFGHDDAMQFWLTANS